MPKSFLNKALALLLSIFLTNAMGLSTIARADPEPDPVLETVEDTALVCSSFENGLCIVRPGFLGQTALPTPSVNAEAMLKSFKARNRGVTDWQKVLRAKIGELTVRLALDGRGLIREIDRAARLYNVPAEAILGAIAIEGTLNSDWKDDTQNTLADLAVRFPVLNSGGFPVTEAERLRCSQNLPTDDVYVAEFVKWDCLNRSVMTNDAIRAKWELGTFGLGQLSLTRVMMVNKLVHDRSGLPLIKENFSALFDAIMDPKECIHYIAANMLMAKRFYLWAGFDIAPNAGLVATLYNLGKEMTLATKLKKDNESGFRAPQLNFFGWLVAANEPSLSAFLIRMRKQNYVEVRRRVPLPSKKKPQRQAPRGRGR